MGIPFTLPMGFLFTVTMGILLTIALGIQLTISKGMDGRGRVYDNIFVERFWRTVKYEEVYLHEYRTVAEAREHLSAYFRFYNEERLHVRLGYRMPHEVYFGTPAPLMPTAEAVV